MSVTVDLGALLDYSDHERRKWREWVEGDRQRLQLPVQPGARFPTVNALLDHVFFVERRHLARLQGTPLPEASGVPAGDARGLFAYADRGRAEFRRYIASLDDEAAREVMSFTAIGIGPLSMTRRRLLTHVIVHEIRHLGQLALAARVAGVEPPGNHDLFLFEGFA